MSRVQFVETVTAAGGVGGTLIPLAGFGATPYTVDINGNEGGQANAYDDRQGFTAASSLVTDASGTVSYWLDAGDYNIYFQDQQAPPRVSDYVRGFTAPIIDTNQLVVGAQNLIQFTGDTKFSMQAADHGLKPDGSFEWLLMNSDPDGGGRQVNGALYTTLRALLGNPPLTAGKFRLPNVSGRMLIAAGAATGLSARNLYDVFGAESHQHTTASLQVDIAAGVLADVAAGVIVDCGGQAIPRLNVFGHTHGLSANGFAQIAIGGVSGPSRTALQANITGSFVGTRGWDDDHGWAVDNSGIGSNQGIALAGKTDSYASGSATQTLGYSDDPGTAVTLGGSGSVHAHAGTVRAHNGTIDQAANGGRTDPQSSFNPAMGMNLFVKT